jgi:hypothetical protein
LLFHCVEALSCVCPAGPERSLGLGLEPSPPTRLRVRPSRHRPTGGPSLFPSLGGDSRSGPASPPAGLAARYPHAPARWLLWPTGRFSPPPSRLAQPCSSCAVNVLGRGVEIAGAAGGGSLRSPRAPDARAVLGRRRPCLLGTPRGPTADRALRSRAEEPAGAGRGGAQARRRPPRHRQNTSLTQ